MPDSSTNAAVVVPIRGFVGANQRLADHLDPATRVTLADAMAGRVVGAAAPLPAFVACDDESVARWAENHGARPLAVGAGLDRAVADALAQLRSMGFDRAVITHADLPLATSFDHLLDDATEVVLVPDRRRDGTNVMVCPTADPPSPSYGPGSFLRHLYAAAAAGHSVRVVQDAALAWDVDTPDDLELPDGSSVLDLVTRRP